MWGLQPRESGKAVFRVIPKLFGQLRSADLRIYISGGPTATLAVSGDRYFAAAGPQLWISLPAGLRQTDIGYEQNSLSSCYKELFV